MPQEPYIIALTGSIGSGKSTVARMLADLGAVVVDADILAREAVAPGTPALAALLEAFGVGIVNKDGSLNRRELANLIFRDSAARMKTEAIIHPKVRDLFDKRIADITAEHANPPLIVYVVPLLFESGMDLKHFKKTIIVSAPEEILIKRICSRDSCSKEDARMRLAAQLPSSEKQRKADIIITNNGDIHEMSEKVFRLYQELTKHKEAMCSSL